MYPYGVGVGVAVEADFGYCWSCVHRHKKEIIPVHWDCSGKTRHLEKRDCLVLPATPLVLHWMELTHNESWLRKSQLFPDGAHQTGRLPKSKNLNPHKYRRESRFTTRSLIDVNLTYVNQLLFLPSLLTVCDIFPFVGLVVKKTFGPKCVFLTEINRQRR